MKRIVMGVLAAAFLIAGSGSAVAEQGTEVEAGVKLWYNAWESKGPDETVISDYVMLIGPAIAVKFPSGVFLDGSLLFSTSDYKFSAVRERWSRDDLEAAIGYMIVEEFGLRAGYKSVWFEEDETGDEETLYGAMLGAVVRVPVSEAFSFYGNLDYLFTRFKLETAFDTFTEDSPGWIVEIGVKYAFTTRFGGNLAYRYESTEGKDSDVRDTFTGVAFGALYTF